MKNQMNFVYEAIKDVVGTIRNLDIKNQVLLGLCVLPLTQIVHVFCVISWIQERGIPCVLFVLYSCLIIWLLSIITLLWGIKGRFNPRAVKGAPLPKGTFYLSGRFEQSCFCSQLFTGVRYDSDFATILASYPSNNDDIYRELVFEHLKLCAIREMKMSCHRWATRFIFAWIFSTIVLFVLLVQNGFQFS